MIDINVTPAKSTLTVAPGGMVWQKILVKNNGSDPTTIKPDIYPFYSADYEGNIQLRDSLLVYDPYSDLNYISLAYPLMALGKQVTLGANEEKAFIFKYSAGTEISPDKYFFVAFEAENEADNPKGLTPAVVIGTPLLISQVESGGTLDQIPKVKDFKVASVSDSLLPIQAKSTVENLGANYYTSRGYWEVVPVIGSSKKYPIINDTIIAKGIRNVRCDPSGNSCRLYPALPMGIFKIRLVLENDLGIIMYKKEKVVVVVPFILISALGALSYLFRSIVNRSSIRQATNEKQTSKNKIA